MDSPGDFALSARSHKQIYMGRVFDPQQASFKGRVASASMGLKIAFPWADPRMVAFITSLPRSLRWDPARGRNKILLRHLLKKELDYDADQVGKYGFETPAVNFHRQLTRQVLDEIGDCGFWSSKQRRYVLTLTRRIQESLDRTPRRVNALQSILSFCLWWNRSEILSRTRSGGGDP
jgi:hypothetical protein